jgi:hypothetical protein
MTRQKLFEILSVGPLAILGDHRGPVRLSRTLLLVCASLTVGCSAHVPNGIPSTAVSNTPVRHFVCDEGTAFRVVAVGGSANVQIGDTGYPLTKKPFSLGERYSSPEASLIIDGHEAVFVAEDGPYLTRCSEVPS